MRDAGRTRGRTVPAGCWARSFPKSCLCNFDDALSIPATILAPLLPTASPYKRVYIYMISPLPLFPRPMTAKVFGGNGWNWNSFHLSIFLLFDKNKCKNIGDWKILLSFSEYFLKIVNTYPLTRLLNFIPYITIFNVSRISRWLYIYSSSLSISNSINFSHRHRILHPSRTYIHPCFQSL